MSVAIEHTRRDSSHARQRQAAEAVVDGSSRLEATLDGLARSLESGDRVQATQLVCRAIQALVDGERVILGRVTGGGRVRVVATTPVTAHRRSELVQDIEAGMRQAVVLKETLTWTELAAAETSSQSSELRQLAVQLGVSTVVCTPIRDTAGQITGVFLVATNESPQVLVAGMRRFAKHETLVSGCLTTTHQRHESTLARAGRGVWSRIARRKALVGLGGILLLAGVAALPWTYRLQCDCKCEPGLRRFVAAPFEGTLNKTLVVPGQRVKKGDVLARMEGREFRSELAGLKAKLNQVQQRYDAALSLGQAADVRREHLEMRHVKTQIDVLEQRIARLEIRSPLDGVVVSGDLKRVEGIQLTIGQRLFEIAPLENLIAEVAIPESEVTAVKAGMPVAVRFDSNPDRQFAGQIDRVHPRAEVIHGDSVFIAEVKLGESIGPLLPGMNGTAAIESGTRSVGWIWFHRPVQVVKRALGW